MKRETTHNTYETSVIVLPFYQNPDKVHVLKYESDDCEVYQKLRRIIDNMNRFLYYRIDNTASYTFYGMEIYTPYEVVDAQYLEALCEAMSRIEQELQTRKGKWGVDRFDHNSILSKVHRVFFDLMYHKEIFLVKYLNDWV